MLRHIHLYFHTRVDDKHVLLAKENVYDMKKEKIHS